MLQVVIIFMRHLRELMVYDPWRDPEHQAMDEAAWRRSAVEFLATVAGPAQLALVARDLASACRAFDADLRAELTAATLELPSVPPGVLPKSHWWWRVDEAVAADAW